jgi:hypothetical protein
MTLDELKKEIEIIKTYDEYNAGIRTIDLMQDYIDAIATGACQDYIDCAQEIRKLWIETLK